MIRISICTCASGPPAGLFRSSLTSCIRFDRYKLARCCKTLPELSCVELCLVLRQPMLTVRLVCHYMANEAIFCVRVRSSSELKNLVCAEKLICVNCFGDLHKHVTMQVKRLT